MEPSTLSRGCFKFHATDIGAGGNTFCTTFQTLSKSPIIKFKTFVLELSNPPGMIIIRKKVRLIRLLLSTFLNHSARVSNMLFLLATEDWGSSQCHTFSNYPGIQLQKAQNMHAYFKWTWLPLPNFQKYYPVKLNVFSDWGCGTGGGKKIDICLYWPEILP